MSTPSNREYDRRRRQAKPWRGWYKTPAWQRRRQLQLSVQPLCERCAKRHRLEPATVANHKIPHRGDRALFFGGELESLCKRCHDSEAQRDEWLAERFEQDEDGWLKRKR